MDRQLLTVWFIAVVAVVSLPKLAIKATTTSNYDKIDCGGNLTSSSGVITSPNYPMEYPSNTDCQWRISVSSSYIIKLRFSSLSIYDSDDYIQVFDGSCESSNKVSLYHSSSGSLRPLRSITNKMCVVFHSDGSREYDGFKASYSSERCPSFTYGKESCSEKCSCIQANSVSCHNVTGKCTCEKGWKGTDCSLDVNECQIYDTCPENAKCVNTDGSYKCICNKGWKGYRCSYDINECKTSNPCPRNAECVNSVGNYTCPCKKGWQGDNCSVDVNECQNEDPCPRNSQCVNSIGGYSCHCNPGYEENSNGQCDECYEGAYGEGCLHLCNCYGRATSYCNKTDGTCVCKDGWSGSDCQHFTVVFIISIFLLVVLLGTMIICSLVVIIKRKTSSKAKKISNEPKTAHATARRDSHDSRIYEEPEEERIYDTLDTNTVKKPQTNPYLCCWKAVFPTQSDKAKAVSQHEFDDYINSSVYRVNALRSKNQHSSSVDATQKQI